MKPAIESADIRSLRKILSEITSDLRNSFAKCIKAGELFTKIKANTKHGDWDGVLQAVGASFNTAKRYMAVWERRSELNLNEIKTLSDAENVFSKIARLEITTTQNEPLTHEKTTNSGINKRPNFRSISDHIGDVGRATPESKNGPPKETAIQLDKVGRPIPENIVADWNEAHNQATELRSTISKVKCILEQARKDKNPLFVEIPQGAISDAESLHFSIGHMLPYAVCPTCQGKLPEKCAMCHHRGFISKSYWEGPTVGNDLRNLIRKQYATSSLSA